MLIFVGEAANCREVYHQSSKVLILLDKKYLFVLKIAVLIKLFVSLCISYFKILIWLLKVTGGTSCPVGDSPFSGISESSLKMKILQNLTLGTKSQWLLKKTDFIFLLYIFFILFWSSAQIGQRGKSSLVLADF